MEWWPLELEPNSYEKTALTIAQFNGYLKYKMQRKLQSDNERIAKQLTAEWKKGREFAEFSVDDSILLCDHSFVG